MNNFPAKLRREISEDPYYLKCCITGVSNVKIDWHHNFIYQGRQLQEKWCILPLAEYIHLVDLIIKKMQKKQDKNILVKIKPLSINECFQGRRFKTVDYLVYEKTIWWLLPKLKIPKGKLKVYLEFGLSSKNADIDNPVKPMVDILQKKYLFNDKQIYHMELSKVDVKKGEEFISFLITAL